MIFYFGKVDLYLDRPANVVVEGFEVYMAALAFVAQAFVRKRPDLIKSADALFSELQEVKGVDFASQAELETGFALGRGLCSLLVGDVDSCRMWLGLDDESFPFRSNSVVDFVREHSNEGGEDRDMLLGLCTLLEHWLTQVVLPRFRDTQNLQSRIGDYYDNQNVLQHLQRLEGSAASPLAAAAAIVKVGAQATAALWNVFPVGTRDQRAAELRRNDKMEVDVMGNSLEESGWSNLNNASAGKGFLQICGVCVAAGLLGWLGLKLSSFRSLPPVKGSSIQPVIAANVTALGKT